MLSFLLKAPRTVFLFIAGDALYALAAGAYQALSPLHLITLGADARLLGLFAGLISLVGLIISPFIGIIADHGHRRAVWLSAIASTFAGFTVLFTSRFPAYWWAAQIFIAYGTTSILIIESAVLASLVVPEERSILLSIALLSYTIFTAAGSAAVGFLAGEFSWGLTRYQAPLLIFTALGTFGLPFFALVPVREAKKGSRGGGIWGGLKPSKAGIIAAVLGGSNGAGHSLITPFIAYIMAVHFGWNAQSIGLLMSLLGIAAIIGPLVSGWLPSHRLTLSITIMFACFAFAFALMLLPISYVFAAGVLLARICRQGLVSLINALINNIARPGEEGVALAWRMVGFNGGAAIASSTGGYLLSSAFPSVIYGFGILIALSAALFGSRVNVGTTPNVVGATRPT